MRFFEIASPRYRIMATKRFMKNAAVFLRGGYPALAKTMKEFLEFKSENPNTPFSKKDLTFRGSNKVLRSFWHAHLVHGKVIVLYQPVENEIRLYDMVDHTATEGSTFANTLSHYVAGLSRNDFTPVAIKGAEADAVTPAEKRELDELLWEMSAQDRDILVAATKGDLVDLMEFMTLTVEKPAEALISAYGGQEGLAAFITQMFRQIGVA